MRGSTMRIARWALFASCALPLSLLAEDQPDHGGAQLVAKMDATTRPGRIMGALEEGSGRFRFTEPPTDEQWGEVVKFMREKLPNSLELFERISSESAHRADVK